MQKFSPLVGVGCLDGRGKKIFFFLNHNFFQIFNFIYQIFMYKIFFSFIFVHSQVSAIDATQH